MRNAVRQVVGLLVLTIIWTMGTTSAFAQGKKSDSVVKVKAEAGKEDKDGNTPITIKLTVDKGWHVYANPVGLEDMADSATTIAVEGSAKLVEIDYPKGKLIKDKLVGDYKVYEDSVTIKGLVRRDKGKPIALSVKFQSCSDSKCLAPAHVSIELP